MSAATRRRPRVGFLGTGWIGRHRLEALQADECVEVAGIADPDPACMAAAAVLAPRAAPCGSLDALLDLDLDGIVIATPSAAHAAQSIAALRRGVAVFCQKPLGRSASEVEEVVEAARQADRLLAVDLSYRFTEPMQGIRNLVQQGALGRIYALDLVFHNAYGPDKPWFYDPDLSGGGCVIDLGVHLVDLALWLLGYPKAEVAGARLLSGGQPLAGRHLVEDYATALLSLGDGVAVDLACSWRLQAGRDAIIAAQVYGTEGGAAMRNVDGSFHRFVGERFHGTSTTAFACDDEGWGGRAIVDWGRRLNEGARFDARSLELIALSRVLDDVYHAGGRGA